MVKEKTTRLDDLTPADLDIDKTHPSATENESKEKMLVVEEEEEEDWEGGDRGGGGGGGEETGSSSSGGERGGGGIRGDATQKKMLERNGKPNEETLPVQPVLLPQILATLVMAVIQVDIGATFAFPGVTLPQLLHNDNNNNDNDTLDNHNITSSSSAGDPHFTTYEAALFASVVHMGAMTGSFLGGVLMVRFGQRVTLVFVLPLSFLIWITLYLASTVWLILTARFMQGVCLSLMSSSTTTYVAEYSHSNYRGRFMACLELFRQVGSLITFLLGCTTLTWRQISLIYGLSNTIVPFLALLYLPNSPRWLAMRGRKQEAHKSLVFFRGRHFDSARELTTILNQMQNSKHMKVTQQLRLLRDPSIFRYFIIMLVVFSLYHFNGSSAISAYIVIIMNDAKMEMSSYLAAVVMAVTKVVGTLFFTLIVDRINRKTLYITTSIISAASLVLLGGYYFDQTHGGEYLQGQDWLPVVCLAVYSFFIMTPVLNLLRSELFPTSVRSTVVPLLYTTFFTGAFVTVQTYPYIDEGLGSYGSFWLYGGCNLILAIIVITTLPETRGKTLEQITEMQRR
ncbi:hypothetical protein Pmani_013155 [Petrolisthes manimaculis]|uniref:Major facilitator superfamily (MFS) profile domain-containing protein n=1 Tax=Petrolisthes manimaculis TaxID=1843537 RepID=A0AAE1PX29_9EUCA|nr:hypothetical protein Pmani_013155 [Petrolisthes manimaculis]